jgi:drug/metabolite transporter (DMT)-like permease
MTSHVSAADRRKGVALMIGAGLAWSTGGVFVRNVDLADPWEIVLWRSVFMAAFLAVAIAALNRGAVLSKVLAAGSAGVISGLLLAATFFFFILSITRNTVANTLALMSTGPFFVAVAGRFFLGERVPLRTWIAIGVALAGIAAMFLEGLDGGRTFGNLLALGVPTAFALNVIVLRRHHASVDMVPAVMLAGLFSIVIAAPLAWPLEAGARDLTVLALMGIVQLGTGCLLMTLATRYLPATEIGLFALIETTLGPVWAWLGVGERPTNLAIVGGLVVVAAVAANYLAGALEARGASPAAAGAGDGSATRSGPGG